MEKIQLQTEIWAQANLTHKYVCRKEYQGKRAHTVWKNEYIDGSVPILSLPEKNKNKN